MAVSRQEQYYNYILGVSNDFSSLPVAVTKHDGELYRLCEIRRDGGDMALRNAIDRVAEAAVREPLLKYNSAPLHICEINSNSSYMGLTYTKNADGSTTIAGTTTGQSFCNMASSKTSLPDNIASGEKYFLSMPALNGDIRVRCYYSADGTTNVFLGDYKDGDIIEIPNTAIGLIMRFQVSKANITINETVKPIFLSAVPNKDLAERLQIAETNVSAINSASIAHASELNDINTSLGKMVFSPVVTVGGNISLDGGDSDGTASNYSRIEYIDVGNVDTLVMAGDGIQFYWFTYDDNYAKLSSGSWNTNHTIDVTAAKYVRATVRLTAGGHSLTQSEINEHTTIYSPVLNVSAEITALKNAVNEHIKPNAYMIQNFVPAKSTRYIYAKGKMWEYHWNTAEAFEAAARDPLCWGISADVRITSDGYFVCYHDETVDSQTDSTGAIEEMTLAQVQQINVNNGVWSGSGWTGMPGGTTAKIPLLTDFLNICRKYGKIAMIEPKGAGSAAVADMSSANVDIIMGYVNDRGMENSVIWITNPTTENYLRSNYPKITKMRSFTNNVQTVVDQYLYDPNTVFMGYEQYINDSSVSYIHNKKRFVFSATNRNAATSVYENLVNKNIDAIFLFIAPPTN